MPTPAAPVLEDVVPPPVPARVRPVVRGKRRGLRAEGGEPDPRFTLANERTFLAYVRTSLAMFAAGLTLVKVDVLGHPVWSVGLGVALVVLGLLASATSYRRWREVELAMRRTEPLPFTAVPLLLTVGLTGLAAVALVVVLVG